MLRAVPARVEKALGRVVRGKVVEFSKSLGNGTTATTSGEPENRGYNPVELGDLAKYLGLPRYIWEAVGLNFDEDGMTNTLELKSLGLSKAEKADGKNGVVYGLVVSGIGEGVFCLLRAFLSLPGREAVGCSVDGDVSSSLFLSLLELMPSPLPGPRRISRTRTKVG